MNQRARLLASLSLALLTSLVAPASAQQALTGTNVVHYDFATFTGAGFAPSPTAGQLDSDEWAARGVVGTELAFGGTDPHEDFHNGTSTGGETGGGIWAFTGVSTCRGTRTLLGVQPSNNTFSPGAFRLQLTNTTGATLGQIAIGYTLAYFNDAPRSVTHTVAVLDAAGTVVTVPSLAFETPVAAGAAEWTSLCRGAVVDLSSLAIADTETLVIEFRFGNGSGSDTRDELGITDVMVGTMPFADGGVPDLDGGVPVDGGADASVLDAAVALDAGPTDAGEGFDGSIDGGGGFHLDAAIGDASASPRDASIGFDASTAVDGGGVPTDGGCGCTVPGRRSLPIAPALAVLAVVLVRLRRRPS